MKPSKKIEFQRSIIEQQKKQIETLQNQINELDFEKTLRQNFENEGYDYAKKLMIKIETDRIILKEAIEKARIAESSYIEMIKKTKPLEKEYRKKLKELNEAIDVTRAKVS